MAKIRSSFIGAVACLLLSASVASAAQITVAWNANTESNIAGYIVEYGTASAPFSLSANVGNVTSWTFTSATPGVTYGFRVLAYNTSGERSDPSLSVFGTAEGANGTTLTADRGSLNFAVINGSQVRTAAQSIRLMKNGTGTVTWTASSSASWLQVSPASGSGTAILTVSLVPSAVPSSNATASITIATTGASNTINPITVGFARIAGSATTPPLGTVDSPANNITGVTGSIAITGWAVDDVDVTRVRIYRDGVGAEGTGLIWVGDATLVEDARPDVAALYPSLPRGYRAGWGYLMLTNMLPSLGNGTFRFSVYAEDEDGHATLLGTRTITCSNNTATQPFGAIDTPAPGESISGSSYNSFGWVLSRGTRRADPPGGGTVSVLIDGVAVGSPTGWSARSDLSALFPAAQFSGIAFAQGVFTFDTTSLAPGMHTMAWVVTDNQGGAAGVGSRYFRVFNSGSSLTAAPSSAAREGASAMVEASSAMVGGAARGGHADEWQQAKRDSSGVNARRGYDLNVPMRHYAADENGRVTVQGEELDRIEVQTNGATAGYLVTSAGLRPLPIGSRLDSATGTFTWQPGVAFIGTYDLAFVRRHASRLIRQDVRVVLNPKGSNRVGPQLVVDLAPAAGTDATGFTVAGWAADLDSPDGTGIQTIHAWAYPRNGGPALFVGEVSYGGSRPDVAAAFGDRFRDAGFGVRIDGLPVGTYDLALFPWSAAKRGWLPAKLVTIEIK
jgi:hypothetical protein